MKEFLEKLVTPLRGLLKKIPPNYRILLLVAAGGFLVGLILFIAVATKPQYTPLFTNLDPSDAAKIIEHLEKNKIPFKLAQEGRTILVPSERALKLRIELASKGLPAKKGFGFEVFYKGSQFGMTEFERRVAYQAALQTELERTIESIEGIESARVHIVLPRPSVFVEEEEETASRAAVFLKVKEGISIPKAAIKGIIYLVAKSVPGLVPENVTVVDQYGTILSEGMELGKVALEKKQMDMIALRKKYRDEISRRIRNQLLMLLEPAYGFGNVAVNVSLDLDFDLIQSTMEIYTPVVGEEGIVRSRQDIKEEFKGKGFFPGGPPGTSSNVPSYLATVIRGATGEYSKRESIVNYEINREVRRVLKTPGAVRRLSVAVLVNKELTDEEKEKIREVVASAVGFDPNRGDRITVEGIKFARPIAVEVGKEAIGRRRVKLILSVIVLGISMLTLVMVYNLLKRRVEVAEETVVEELAPVAAPRVPGVPEAPAPEVPLTPEEAERKERWEAIEGWIKENPKDAANLIRVWLFEE